MANGLRANPSIPIAFARSAEILRIQRVKEHIRCLTCGYVCGVGAFTIGCAGPDNEPRCDPIIDGSYWDIWLTANATLTHGTYLRLYDDGRMYRITDEPNNYNEQLIKDKDDAN